MHNIDYKRICPTSKTNWDKADTDQYKILVQSSISEFNKNFQSIQDIEHAYRDLNLLVSKAPTTAGPTKQMKKRRPRLQVMTPEIRKALNEKKKAYYEWKLNDWPSNPYNQWLKKKKRNINYFKKGVQDNASEIVIRENKLTY